MEETTAGLAKAQVLKRVGMGVGSSALAQAIAAVQAFLLVPFFLRAWGADGYGHWITLTALVSYLALLDLGGQNYIANLLAIAFARHDENGFRQTLSEGVSLFLVLGVCGYALFALFVAFFSIVSLPGLSRPLAHQEAAVLLLLGAVPLLMGIPGGVYATGYRATGLYVRGAMLANIVRGFGILVLAALLYASVSPTVYALGLFATGALLTVVITLDLHRRVAGCRGLRIGLAQARRGWIHLGGALRFWMLTLAQTITQQGTVLVLAAGTSPAIVALYSTHRTLSSIPNYIGSLIQGPVLPELSFFWAQQRLSDLSRVTFLLVRTIVLMTGAVGTFLWLFAPVLYPLWTRGRLQVQPLLLGVLLVQGLLAAGWATSGWTLLATNHHRLLARWSMVSAVLTICLAIWLAPRYGAVGAAGAGLAGDLACGIVVYPVLASAFLGVPARRMFFLMASAILVLAPFTAAAFVLNFLLSKWWSLAAFVFLTAACAYPALLYIAGPERAKRGVGLLREAWNWKE